METGTIDNKPGQAPAAKPNHAEEREGFENVLADFQAVQLAGTARLFAAPSGIEVREGQEAESARQARVSQQTQDARAAEVQANETRGADPAAVERGEVSSRRQRILESKAHAAAKPEAADKSAPAKDADSRAHQPALDARVTRVADRSDAKSQADPVAKSTSGSDKVAKASVKPDVTSSSQRDSEAPRPANGTTVTVATAGAARARENAERVAGDTPAKSVAKLLAGRGTTESVKAQSPVAGQETAEKGSTSQGKTSAAARDGSGTARETKGQESASSARRSEFQRLVQSIRFNAGSKTSSATIRLDPPDLGKVRVDVRMVDDVLRVRVEASTAQARELLNSRVNDLTAALREHAIEVREFDVVDTSQAGREQSRLSQEGSEQSQWDASQAGEDGSDRAFADSTPGDSADTGNGEVEDAPETEMLRESLQQVSALDVRV